MNQKQIDRDLDELGEWHATFPNKTPGDVMNLIIRLNDKASKWDAQQACNERGFERKQPKGN